MKPLRSVTKWLLAVVVLLFALLILKIALVLTAKPKITVDYVAEYNRITRPANYDPNDNAAPYYQKALDAFVSMPYQIRYPKRNWLTDYNSTEQALLENWLTSNSQAFEYFKTAANKPYYWLERYTDENNNMLSMQIPELSQLRHLSEALLWNAKLAAYENQPQTAFENIIDCYLVGYQKCRTPSFLIEQVVGMELKKTAIDNALAILDKTHIDNSALKSFQDTLQTEFDKDTHVLDFAAERMILYDILQMTFVDNGRGTGRFSWSAAKYFETMCGRVDNFESKCKLLLKCFFGPTRNDMVVHVEKYFASFNVFKTETPWQFHSHNPAYSENLHSSDCADCDDFILDQLAPSAFLPFNIYHQVKTDGKALLAVIAIHRFKAEKGMLPATLDELVSAGYLQSVPMDPYSDGPLVYKPAGDNFKLYSVGENFSDDGGSNELNKEVRTRSAFGTPVLDIVYWPVNKFKDPGRALYPDELKKLRAAKEADVLGTAQDPNLPTFNK